VRHPGELREMIGWELRELRLRVTKNSKISESSQMRNKKVQRKNPEQKRKKPIQK
jgi:hypothetical protein